ncbi:alpha/beta fold hydrolase [Thiohalobacter thiocyanaticus]|uniref:Alpha/beta fold hydrolase n=1 Tax=Thiohalobacter thiocyanaticus TaxID=585455 RepID=A0A426QMI5_9GAMM|nr:alpha/beta fold hydrolase [Thiohalobacter thiocyanaticus]RRQ22960.1 alpha/beta fold hydrolase [Thiohalobacter thiocyanaticus]
MRQRIQFCTSRDGCRLAYARAGTGPPLVRAGNWLTHLDLDWHSPVWQHWLEALTRRHTLIRYDLRGSGLSGSEVGDASLATWVDDLDAVVNDRELERFPLLGLCQGGVIALAYAARHPERVSRLVLYDTYTCGALVDDGDPGAAREAELLTEMIEIGWGRETAAFRELFASLLMPDAPAESVRWLGELQRRTVSPANAARLWRAFHRLDVRSLATQVRVPTLVVHVRGDCVVPYAEGERLAGLIPGAEFVVLDSRNHILRHDEPAWQRFIDELHAFLARDHPATGKRDGFSNLTPREREVLEHVARGLSNDEIATALGLRPKTVRNHVSRLFDKLEVNSRARAVARARDAGFG